MKTCSSKLGEMTSPETAAFVPQYLTITQGDPMEPPSSTRHLWRNPQHLDLGGQIGAAHNKQDSSVDAVTSARKSPFTFSGRS
jgi:hypothetical protein